MNYHTKQHKKGAASIFVVIFTTILLSVITLGFVRIMLAEAERTSNYDLSQSAYDSALAGVEDAKTALLIYHNCLSSGDTASRQCKPAVDVMRLVDSDGNGSYDGPNDNNPEKNCDAVKQMLGRPGEEDTETVIQSEEGNLNSAASEGGEAMNQAYTCVTISEDNDNYISELNENYRSKVVPLRTTNIDDVASIKFEWAYNDTANSLKTLSGIGDTGKLNKLGYGSENNSGWFSSLNRANTPPEQTPASVILEYMQADDTFTLAELNVNNGEKTDRGTLLLVPTQSGGASKIANSGAVGFASSADKSINNPIPVNCSQDTVFMCSVTIDLPEPHKGGRRDDGAAFLRVSLPYGVPDTDFSITMYNKDGTTAKFSGVQAKIDSTGRSADLFRRVEARVELVDVYFPFPEFAVTLGGDGNELSKDFWVTKNNWFGKDSGKN